MLWWIKDRGKAPEKFAGIMTRGEYGRDSVFLCIILAAPFIHIKLYSIILIVKINFTQFVLKEVVVFWWQCIRLRPMLARLTHLLILTFFLRRFVYKWHQATLSMGIAQEEGSTRSGMLQFVMTTQF